MLKLLFAGTPDVAVPSLRTLAADTEHFEVVAVLTRPDAAQGRGRKLVASPVKQAAQELGLPVLECDPNEPAFVAELKVTGAQAAAVVAYGKILKEPVLEALPMGWYNLHFSLLPQWRGAAPVQRSIWAGDTLTGASVFRIQRGMDDGPILAQSTTEIGPHDTAGDILDRLARDGSHLLAASLQAMADNQIQPVEQPAGAYEVAKKISVEDAHIRFDVPVFAADRQIRACTPTPGAWCRLFGHGVEHINTEPTERNGSDANDALEGAASFDDSIMLHVLKAHIADMENAATPHDLQPGALKADKKHVWAGTKTQPLELLEVKAQGKKAMVAADWARGAHLADNAYCD
jgi:methionyl-tRNA formyltransferase